MIITTTPSITATGSPVITPPTIIATPTEYANQTGKKFKEPISEFYRYKVSIERVPLLVSMKKRLVSSRGR